MSPHLLLIGDQELIVNVIANNIDRLIFTSPLTILHPQPQDMVLSVPSWLRCTPDKHFTIEKMKITMILTPTDKLKDAYIKIINEFTEAQKKNAEEAKTKQAPPEKGNKK